MKHFRLVTGICAGCHPLTPAILRNSLRGMAHQKYFRGRPEICQQLNGETGQVWHTCLGVTRRKQMASSFIAVQRSNNAGPTSSEQREATRWEVYMRQCRLHLLCFPRVSERISALSETVLSLLSQLSHNVNVATPTNET